MNLFRKVGRSSAIAALALLSGTLSGVSGGTVPPNLATASAGFLKNADGAARQRLVPLADKPAPAGERSLAAFVLGMGEQRRGNFSSALVEFRRATNECTELCDYVDYHYALSSASNGDYAGSAAILKRFRDKHPDSPYLQEAFRLRLTSLIRAGDSASAFADLREDRLLSMPERLLMRASAAAAQGEHSLARDGLIEIYTRYPASPAAEEAYRRLASAGPKGRLRVPLSGQQRLKRADLLFDAGKYDAAKAEYKVLSAESSDAAALAQFRLHALAIRASGPASDSCVALSGMQAASRELAAEGLYWLLECAKKAKDEHAAEASLKQLHARHAESEWHERALLSYGNYLLLKGSSKSRFYYGRLAQMFPKSSYAAKAHWKAAWQAYLAGDSTTSLLLNEHTKQFADSETAAAASFWTAKLAENESNLSQARSGYRQLAKRWPNHFYGLRALSRLDDLDRGRAGVSITAGGTSAVLPPKNISLRLNRSRILSTLSLDDLAEFELKNVDSSLPGAYWVGMELAERAVARGEYHAGVRWMKRFAPGYLSRSFDAYPRRFWELMFPLPWRDQLVRESYRHALDPHLVAALVRQESEFNPNALSTAGAYGLMQIMPATGAQIARSLERNRTFRTPLLKQAEVNLEIGTRYLRNLMDQFGGAVETALAGYNAGPSRAKRWSARPGDSTAEEFIENIPFTETREYVAAVLRNREIYKRIYELPATTKHTAANHDTR